MLSAKDEKYAKFDGEGGWPKMVLRWGMRKGLTFNL